jgi:precorrin-4 C11-methyltransferase
VVGRAAGPDTYAELRAIYGGRVSFVGAGPGAADLITVRGARRIAEADVVVWAASLVAPECVHENARPDAELIDSSKITLEDVLAIYRRAAREKLRVARVHSGDPALWGAVQEQYDACVRLGLEVEIVPGVSAFSAAAAAIGRELTVPEVAQSIVLTRLEGGKTPMPPGERIRDFARHGTTMAVFLSAARTGQLAEELRAGGYAEDTPVVVAYKASWPDELLLYTTLGELELTVKQNKLWRHTLFLIGRALDAAGTRSRLYNAGHFHTYRKADPAARQALRAESGAGSAGSTNGAASGASTEPARGRRSKRWSAAAHRAGEVAARLPAAHGTDLGRAEDAGPTASSEPSDEAAKPAKTASSKGTTASSKIRAASTSSEERSESTPEHSADTTQ